MFKYRRAALVRLFFLLQYFVIISILINIECVINSVTKKQLKHQHN